MTSTVDIGGRPFHFIGIGGIGMSALAFVLAKQGISVSGSDLRSTPITQRLAAAGVRIFDAQQAGNLDHFMAADESARRESALATVAGGNGSLEWEPSRRLAAGDRPLLPQVICSTAIRPDNPEYQAARQRGCPIFHRSELLAALMQYYDSIAVAGTHGKTTTSSLIGYILVMAGIDPTVVVGGEIAALGGNARLGASRYLVAEADESDGSLATLAASLGIITNIELDHPDHYRSLSEVVHIFKRFTAQCQATIGCLDCETVRQYLQPDITYSLDPQRGADYTVRNPVYQALGTVAEVWERGSYLGTLRLRLLGKHNLANALAAIAVSRQLGLTWEAIAPALASFEGACRRFEHRGTANGITFIDDYAHHPSEIAVTLAAGRLQVAAAEFPARRLVAIFQPHRYSRTQVFLEEFAACFAVADVVVVSDIYSAGEPNPHQLSGRQLAEAIAARQSQVFYQPDLSMMASFLKEEILQPNDLAIFLGAGNLNQVINPLLDLYGCSVAT
ncbi:MAG: UDP-N-acetylmuramate--L-alanine ligase [Spirulinaceae cyanobacterium RM2_2_10]|nr:UDP-N-acetylmuramate--L-alanine ligase [Spirulinaceae cyanobacterium SM2_1_0]NJO19073.1 UDP-N-acetylmuramate--L-alanine ligase [Spirulinaceae cyanobacterium RM2_2_10]